MMNWTGIALDGLCPYGRGGSGFAPYHPLHAQATALYRQLERGITHLAAGQGTFKDMSALFPMLRMAHCEHHYVFCLPRENASALVVAIFHERMDLMARLADRLKLD